MSAVTATFEFKCGCQVDVTERPPKLPLFVLRGQDEGLTPAIWWVVANQKRMWHSDMARMVLKAYCPHVDVPYDEKRELQP